MAEYAAHYAYVETLLALRRPSARAPLRLTREGCLAATRTVQSVGPAAADIAMTAEESLNHISDLKAKMQADKIKLDQARDDATEAIGQMDSNSNVLEARAAQIKGNLANAQDFSSPQEMDPSAIESMITPGDAISEKIIKMASKYNALDECMSAVKKGFEKEKVDLETFLSTIRELSGK